jgi:uncharacterized membrane protein YdbT with pleckstrin-like domain
MPDLFSFLSNTNYSFEGKKEGEEVIIFLHRHWITLFGQILIILIGGLLPFLAIFVFGSFISSTGSLPYFATISAFYYLILWYAFFYSLTMYTLDSWIVTNMRIINSVQTGFFNRQISELALDKIQDVSFHTKGALATFINYGDINVQTAGSDKHFKFEQIGKPQAVKDQIMELVATKKHEFEHQLGQGLREELFGEI